MKKLRTYIIPIAIWGTVFAVVQYFHPSPLRPETARLECFFEATEQSQSVTVPYSQTQISSIDFKADLTGKFVDESTILWHAKGLASYQGGSQRMEGSVFLSPNNEVRGLGLYRDRYPHQANDLRISTLNENGKLDWDENSVFVYFENALEKMTNPFEYRCSYHS